MIPDQPENTNQDSAPPMVYVSRPLEWEYKQVMFETPPDDDALNALGKQGWELAGITPEAVYIFKRVID